MIYRLLKSIIKLSLNIYFRRIDVIGQKNVPETGPIIFVANHPSALIDPLLCATELKRELNFLAGSEWFGNGLKAKFFKTQLNMIPVHRPWLANGKKVSNDDMFKECYKSLEKGKCIILFPEASSASVSKVRELKTGAIRIKSGYEEFMNNNATVPIVPIGLSYSDQHEFQSRVVVKIGEPIIFKSVEKPEDKADVFRLQTKEMREALKKTIVHIDNKKNEGLVKKIIRLYLDTQELIRGISFKNSQNKFEFNQQVAQAVEHFEETDKDGYTNMSNRIDNYFSQLNDLGIADDYLGKTKRSKISVFTWLFLLLGLVVAIPSLILFTIPYQYTKSLFLKKFNSSVQPNSETATLNESFEGTLLFAIGALIFITWTILISITVGLIFGIVPGAISFVIMYPMMRFSMYYSKIALRFKQYYKTKNKISKNKSQFEELLEERESLVEQIKKYQVVYDSSK